MPKYTDEDIKRMSRLNLFINAALDLSNSYNDKTHLTPELRLSMEQLTTQIAHVKSTILKIKNTYEI